MPPMSDEPLSLGALAEFHRQTSRPDVQRIVAESERRLIDQIERLWDALLDTRERLEVEYQTVKAGLARVEHGLDPVGSGLADLRARLDALSDQVRAIPRPES
jgi:septal ring factor EnvC (AmiA/AmiB activator)